MFRLSSVDACTPAEPDSFHPHARRDFGGNLKFSGRIATVKCFENNPLVRQVTCLLLHPRIVPFTPATCQCADEPRQLRLSARVPDRRIKHQTIAMEIPTSAEPGGARGGARAGGGWRRFNAMRASG